MTQYEIGRLEAVCKCAAVMIDEKRPDIARDIFNTMKIDGGRLSELKRAFIENRAKK